MSIPRVVKGLFLIWPGENYRYELTIPQLDGYEAVIGRNGEWDEGSLRLRETEAPICAYGASVASHGRIHPVCYLIRSD